MMMSKMKFGLNIKQNISVMSSVQLSNIPKVDAVEIQCIQFCSVQQTVLCIICLKKPYSLSFELVKLKFQVFKTCF